MRIHRYAQGTYLQSEEAAYPNGRMARRGLAKWPDGKLRRVWAGLPDTFYTVPAWGRVRGRRVKGYLAVTEDGVLIFNYEEVGVAR